MTWIWGFKANGFVQGSVLSLLSGILVFRRFEGGEFRI